MIGIDRDRAVIRVEIDLDPVPGACHTGDYWQRAIAARLDCPWYHPNVRLVKVKTFPVRRSLRRLYYRVRYSRLFRREV